MCKFHAISNKKIIFSLERFELALNKKKINKACILSATNFSIYNKLQSF